MRIEEIRSGLCRRLRARRGEIEQIALTRVSAISDPKETADPEYAQGLRAAVAAAIDYGIAALEQSEDCGPPIPTVLLSQARLAARAQVPLATVLRRYFAGYTLLGDFVIEEAERGRVTRGTTLKRLLRAQAALFDRVVAAVSEEYGREAETPGSAVERRARLAQRLLNGELVDAALLNYALEGWHVAAVGVGASAGEALHKRADALDRRLLLIRRKDNMFWAWVGGRHTLSVEEIEFIACQDCPEAIHLAIGEPGEGPAGWRLSHRQAIAALSIALRGPKGITRYADVALVASALQDEVLATSLRAMYLDPLARERDGGRVARQTLRAYFAANRNISSAAASLGATRHTVTHRLRTIEERLGRHLPGIAPELEAALRIEELGPPQATCSN